MLTDEFKLVTLLAGPRLSDVKVRAAMGLDQGALLALAARVRIALGVDAMMTLRDACRAFIRNGN